MTTPRIETPLYSLSAPELFEKQLIAGQLLRLERMDRQPDEASFAEANLFVGFVDEEGLDPPVEGANAWLLQALWDQYRNDESGEGVDVIDTHESEREIVRTVRLAPQPWRPESGALVWFHLPPASGRPVFARFVLEYDWAKRGQYEPVGREILRSLEWNSDAVSEKAVVELAAMAWSSFDDMEASQREALKIKYRQIQSQQAMPPTEPDQSEPQALDLTALDMDKLTMAQLEERLVDSDGEQVVLLKIALLPDLVELTIVTDDPDEYSLGPGTLEAVRALGRLGEGAKPKASELFWAHCKMCFETTDYGADEKSNEDFFGIHGPEDAFREAGVGSIHMSERLNGGTHDLFQIDFYPPWEDEHGCSLVVRGGELVAHSNPGGWMGEFAVEQ